VKGPITVVLLTGTVTEEMRRSVPVLLDRGFKVLVGVTAHSSELEAFVAEYAVEKVEVPWTGDFSDAFNLLFDRVPDGVIVRLDNDEWMTAEQADELIRWMQNEEPPFVATLISRNMVYEGRLDVYAEAKTLRMWPAKALLTYVNRVHERPRKVDIDVYLNGKPMSHLDVFYWHSGLVRERRREKAIRDIAAIRKILETEPDSLFFRATLGASLMEVDREGALDEFYRCAEILVDLVKSERCSRVPAVSEMVIAHVLFDAKKGRRRIDDYDLLEQIGLRQFDRSFQVIWASMAWRLTCEQYEAALYYALRAQALQKTGGFSLSWAADPETIAAIPNLVDQIFQRVPSYIRDLRKDMDLMRFLLPNSA